MRSFAHSRWRRAPRLRLFPIVQATDRPARRGASPHDATSGATSASAASGDLVEPETFVVTTSPAAPAAPAVAAAPPGSFDGPGRQLLRVGEGGILRATALMAGGTALSRLTGLIRLLVAAYALGGNRLSDAFNMANNTPNIVHDLVLGGVLAATFVPQFVERLSTRSGDEATESISAVVTLSSVLLCAATVLFVVLSPFVIDLYAAGASGRALGAEKGVATDLLRLFAFQLLAYGAISLMTALLNTVRRFVLVTYVPVLNNLVSIGVLLAFASAVSHRPSLAAVAHDRRLVLLLGIGTTLGVVIQALALVPATLRCGLRLRPLFRPRDPAIREILSLSGWTMGFVGANQVALFVVLAIAVHLGASRLTDYSYAFQFFQLPFGIIAVSVMSAITPELAHRHSTGDRPELRRQFGLGLRRMLAGIIPATAGYLILAGPGVTLLLRHGAFTAGDASLTARLLALLAIGLPGYCTYLFCIRGLQAMRDTRTAFFLYLGENTLNVVLAFVLTGIFKAAGLSLSLSIAYSISALAALIVVRAKMGGLGGAGVVGRYVMRYTWLSIVMAAAVAVVTAAVGSSSGPGLALRVVAGVLVGIGVYGGGASLATRWQTAGRRQKAARKRTDAPNPSRH
ncbi:MAG: murein biosynthesis integral membrane protein MurJ [Acidimicrobiales bacterium]